jgi:hypothetical protein
MRINDAGVFAAAQPGSPQTILTFPAALALESGQLVASYRTGTAKDTDDEAIEVRRSTDLGRTWSPPQRPFGSPVVDGHRGSLKVCYFTQIGPRHLLAGALWVDRESHPGKPLFNPDTEGCLPMAVLLADPHEDGVTWSPWRKVTMPADIGPPSLTNPIIKLEDGTLAMSVETNKVYSDATKWFQRVVFRHSSDQGQTWAPPVITACDPTGRIRNWDQRVCVDPNGCVAAFQWTYDTGTEKYLNMHRRVSRDNGRTWSSAEDLGFADQAAHPAVLPDGRVVLAWVDRFDTQTIRARMAPAVDGPFDPDTEVTLYTHAHATAGDVDTAGALGLSVWSFGLPYAEALPDGNVLVLYYAGTEQHMDIRYARLEP